MKLPRWCLSGILLAATAGACAAQEGSGSPSTLAEVWFDFGDEVAFDSYSIDLTLRLDLSTDAPLLIAPIFRAAIGGRDLTAGAFLQAGGYHFKHQRDREDVPSAAVLRMAGPPDVNLARTARDGGMYDWASDPDPYLGLTLPISWKKGRYTLILRKESASRVDEKPFTWIGYYVYSHISGTETFVGSIRFPGTKFTLGGKVGAAIAVPVSDVGAGAIPRTALTLGAWRINDTTTLPFSATARYPAAAPAGAVCSLAGKEVEVQIGPNMPRGRIQGLRTADGAQQHILFSRPRP
jgi:hypothetical protein